GAFNTGLGVPAHVSGVGNAGSELAGFFRDVTGHARFNLGLGNIGSGNVGSGNIGGANVGSGNIGDYNI
ncbi:pentapeptide repeat-containing protein, partial [Mycobacterium marinum]